MQRLSSSRLPLVVLVVVIVWALVAVVLLIGTLRNAQSIDASVETIDDRVTEIDQDLEAVRLAGRTADIAARILEQAQPLDDQLARIVRLTGSIDRTALHILLRARSIETTADSISARTISINRTVAALATTVVQIERNAESIEARARAVDTDDIESRFVAVLRTVRSIDGGVEGINVRASAVIDIVRRIERGLSLTRAELGPERRRRGKLTVHGHAHDIDCRLNPEKDYCGDEEARRARGRSRR